MASQDSRILWCFVDGLRAFKVSVRHDVDVDDLQETIKDKKKNALCDFDLILWKVRISILQADLCSEVTFLSPRILTLLPSSQSTL